MTNEDHAMTQIHLVMQFPQKRNYLIEVKRGEYIARSGEERFGPSLYLDGFQIVAKIFDALAHGGFVIVVEMPLLRRGPARPEDSRTLNSVNAK